MKMKVKATKLGNADVNYISLVERGANRAPFKIIKQEKSMINLDRLGSIFKGDTSPAAASSPQLSAVIITKEDNHASVLLALSGAGVKVDASVVSKDETEAAVLLKQDDEGTGVVIKMADDFAIVLKGFDPYSMGADASFTDTLNSQGFMPGFSMAVEALHTSVRNALVGATDQAAAVSKIEDYLSEFQSYMVGLSTAIPSTAFKALDAFRAAKDEVAPKEEPAAKKEEAAPVVVAATEVIPAGPAAAATAVPPEDKDIDALVAKATDSVIAPLGKAMGELTALIQGVQKSIGDLTTKVDGIESAQGDLKTGLAATTELAQKAEAAVKGNIVGGAPVADDVPNTVTKSEGSIGCFDTAYRRDVRKSDQRQSGNGRQRSHML